MKKSDLFKRFEIEKSEYPTILGGITTSMDSDTNSTGGHDIMESTNKDGEYVGIDIVSTGPGDKDKPKLEIAP